ncbi:MAG: phosphoribosylformylglycinamidine synthase subunit PurL [Firmicutes bacterium]|nr:phosphoribosylformylglycinamidine synthase subunit PurL [Bacillota bacterium]
MSADNTTKWEEMGISADEYGKIVELLNRKPNELELALFSVMWSEHCGYKYSRALLPKLPTTGSQILQGPGENAGIIDIGDGQAIVMKIESHNHPSAVWPYAGAATGVGGILRDIFTMGARPIAALNSLRFGKLSEPHQQSLLKGVVEGMAGYGNTVGVPMIAGEIYFDESYSDNCLVNAMAVGLLQKGDPTAKGLATGVGNPVMAAGTPTGREGIEGASFASEELTSVSEERRAAIPQGYPETGKKLIEASLEAIGSGHLIGIQDMGAAGLTSSASEMAYRGEHGIELDLDLVPVKEDNMTPYEIMLSETQERMLFVVKAGRENDVKAIFAKWDIPAAVVGKVTDDGMMRLVKGETILAEVSAEALASAPMYQPETRVPAYLKELLDFDPHSLPEPKHHNEVLLKLLSSPNIASKEWAYKQFDYQAQGNTLKAPGETGAGLVGINGTNKAVGFTVDCNARLCYLDPQTGAAAAVAEAGRNLVVSGAKPLAVTDGLNFGNPEKPEIYWQFSQTIAGITKACSALDTPVVGGNVSFYNESQDQAIRPTPIIGMLGLINDAAKICTKDFKDAGDVVVLLGSNRDELGGSEYLAAIHDLTAGKPPALDLELEKRLQTACLEAIEAGLVKSAHDCSEGGLATALAECSVQGKLGASVTLDDNLPACSLLYGESHSRIVVSTTKGDLSKLIELVSTHNVPVKIIGEVQPGTLEIIQISDNNQIPLIQLEVEELESAWRGAIACHMKQ